MRAPVRPAPPSTEPELHLASLVLHVVPLRLADCAAAAAAVAGAEIHATSPAGKIIVTLEASSDADLQTSMAALQGISGVIAATLVYQHAEPLASMTEEILEEPRDAHVHDHESPASPTPPLHQAIRGGGGSVDSGHRPARCGPEPGH